MKRLIQLLSVASLLLSVQPAFAQALHTVQAPPARGSAEDQADFDAIFAQQVSRTEADCERARTEVDESLATFFGPPYGPLNPVEVARLAASFDRFAMAAEPIVKAEKEHWARLRPYLEDTRVQPCVPKQSKFSYPSGHATLSQVFAEILTRIYPERDPALYLNRARQVGEDRVLSGVHHPSDIVAGRQLGHEIVAQWLQDSNFREELERLRALRSACPLR